MHLPWKWLGLGSSGSRRPRSGRRSFRPLVEQLDAREVPTTGLASPFGVAAQDLEVNAGEVFSGVVGFINDQYPSTTQAVLKAQINWGDGTISTPGTVAGPDGDGLFEITASHTYNHAGSYTLSVAVQDTLHHVATTPTASVTVDANPNVLTVTGVNVTAFPGIPFTGVIGVVHDTAAGSSAANLAGTVNWGDGSNLDTVTIIPTSTPGYFQVLGTHTYFLTGTDEVNLWIRDNSLAQSTTTTSTVSVALPGPGAITVTAIPINAVAGQNYSAVLGIIHDSSITASVVTLTAVVSWGDGSVEIAQLQPMAAPGFFEVLGQHTYDQSGLYQLIISVQDNTTGAIASDTSAVLISEAPPAVTQPAPSVTPPTPTPAPTPPLIGLFRRRHRTRHHGLPPARNFGVGGSVPALFSGQTPVPPGLGLL